MTSIKNDAMAVGTVGVGAAALAIANQNKAAIKSAATKTGKVVAKPFKAMGNKDTYIAAGKVIKDVAKKTVDADTYKKIADALGNTCKKVISPDTYKNAAKKVADVAKSLYGATKSGTKKAGTAISKAFKAVNWKQAGKIGAIAAGIAATGIAIKAIYDNYTDN